MTPFRYTQSLWTGSRVYGTPTPESDWDIVWRCNLNRDGLSNLRHHATSTSEPSERYRGPGLYCTMRFGPINFILVHSEAQLDAWKVGTKMLLAEAPVTRDRAIEVFSELFNML